MSAKVQPLEMGKTVRKEKSLSIKLSSFKARIAGMSRIIPEPADPDSLSHIAKYANQDRSRLPDRKQVEELERFFCALDDNSLVTRSALNLDPSYLSFLFRKGKLSSAFVFRAICVSMLLFNLVMFHIIFRALHQSPHWFYHIRSACNRIRDEKTDTWVFRSIQRYLKMFRVLLILVSICMGMAFLSLGIMIARYDTLIGCYLLVYAIFVWFSGAQASVFQYWLMLRLNLLLLILETRAREFFVELETLGKLEYQQVQPEASYSPQVGESLNFAAIVRKHKEVRAETNEICKCLEGPLLTALLFSTTIQLGSVVLVFSAGTASSLSDLAPVMLLFFSSLFAFLPSLVLLKKLTAISKLHKDIVQYSSDLYCNDEYALSEIKFKMYMTGFTPGLVLYGTVLDNKLVARIIYFFITSALIVVYRVISILEK